MMSEEVKSAPEATQIAEKFVEKHFFFTRPLTAIRKDDTWTVEIDVGPIIISVATVKIDAKSREILEYSFPK